MRLVGGPDAGGALARLVMSVAATALLAGLLAACRSGRSVATASRATPGPGTASTTADSGSVTAPPGVTRYQQAVDGAASRGVKVWLEADLAKRWLAGSDQFHQGVVALGQLASRPGVVGIKVADELGYHSGLGDDVNRVLKFLADTRSALSQAAAGKQLLVDFVVPDLGCAPGMNLRGGGPAGCTAKWDGEYPALALDQLDRVFASGSIDVADISTGLEADSTYTSWGITRDQAQTAGWAEIRRRGWSQRVRLQARKALAHSDSYSGGPAQAQADTRTFIDIPLSAGAQAVDIWAWREVYKGQVVRLMDPQLVSNPLWQDLRQRRAAGDTLFTHFTPSQVDKGLDQDLDQLAQVFTNVFVAAGIG
jgi:hypothetical protein